MGEISVNSLRRALALAEDRQREADLALQRVSKYLKFKGFELGDEPKLSMCTGYEIILEWHGAEVDGVHILSIMKEAGYLSPGDFF